MKKKSRGLLSLLLVVVLLFSSASFAAAEAPETVDEAAVTRMGEVEALRQTNSETYLLSDGSYECVVYSEDKYYYDSANTLQRIDNSIVAAGAATLGTQQYKNAANIFDVTFSGSGVPQIGISHKGKSMTFSPLNASNGGNDHISATSSVISIGKIDNCTTLDLLTDTGSNTVTYSNAFAGADLVYVLENNALKEYIILNSVNAPNTFHFLFNLDGVTLETANGVAAFVDSSGETVFALGQLFAVDAAGEATEALSYTFTPVKETGVIVTVTLDNAYLSSAEREFPVVIDPSIVISSVQTADTCVCSGFPDTNYYTAYQLRTGYDSDYGIRRSYIKFDIPTSIPASSIAGARLDIEKVSGKTPLMRAYLVLGAWTSSTLTWNNRPSYTAAHQSPDATLKSDGSNWFSMNVTDIVRNWASGSYVNYGFMLKDQHEASDNDWVTFYSSDASSPHEPELHIFYDIPTVNLQLVYDTAYSNRYSSANEKITAQAKVLQDKYLQYGIFVNYSDPVMFQSYADQECTTIGPGACTHASNEYCINSVLYSSGNIALSPMHHKNFYNIVLRIPFPNTASTLKMAYIGHDICEMVGTTHEEGRHLGGTYEDIGLAAITNHISETSELMTMVHEFGHFYGAPDHYGRGSVQTTADIIYETGDGRFNENCIYGESNLDESIINSLTICDGCAAVIMSNFDEYSH